MRPTPPLLSAGWARAGSAGRAAYFVPGLDREVAGDPALHHVQRHRRDDVAAIRVGAVLDEGDAVGPDHIAFVEHCAYPDGCNVVSAMTLDVVEGRIARHLTVQAWDEVSCSPG